MNEKEFAISIIAHATSKLSDYNLITIEFLGFIGEAFAAIVAVAK